MIETFSQVIYLLAGLVQVATALFLLILAPNDIGNRSLAAFLGLIALLNMSLAMTAAATIPEFATIGAWLTSLLLFLLAPAFAVAMTALLRPNWLTSPQRLGWILLGLAAGVPALITLADLIGLTTSLFSQPLLFTGIPTDFVRGQAAIATYLGGPLNIVFGAISLTILVVVAVAPLLISTFTDRRTLPGNSQIGLGTLVLMALAVPVLGLVGITAFGPNPGGTNELSLALLFNLFVLALVGLVVSRSVTPDALSARLRTLPLRLKLVIFTGVVGLPVLVLLVVVAGAVISNLITIQAGESLRNIADVQATRVNLLIETELNNLRTLATDPVLVEAILEDQRAYAALSPAVLNQRLQNDNLAWLQAGDDAFLVSSRLQSPAANNIRAFQRLFPNHVDTLVVNAQGALVAATNRPERFYLATDAWFAATLREGVNGEYITPRPIEYNLGGPGRQLGIYLVVPVRDPATGLQIATLRSTLPLTLFSQTLRGDFLDPSQNANLFTATDERFATTENIGVGVKLIPLGFVDGPAANDRWAVTEFDGVEQLIAWQPINNPRFSPVVNNLGWQVLVTQTLAATQGPIELFVNASAIVVPAAILANVLLSVALAAWITQPVTELTRAAQAVSAGDYEAPLPLVGEDELGQLTRSIEQMRSEVQHLTSQLQDEVRNRTAQLAVVNQFTQAIVSPNITPSQLLSRAVALIQQSFDFYQVSIFLIDEERNLAVVNASAGPAAESFLARRHSLPIGNQSVVGFVALNNRPRVVANVGEDAVHFKNPLLPNTKAELGLPLAIGERVLGVLDVQSTEIDAFDENDIRTFESIANQISISLENARLINQLQENLQEMRGLQRQYMGTAWQSYSQQLGDVRLRLQGTQVLPASELPPLPLGRNAAMLTLPIQVRGFEVGQLRLPKPPNRDWTPEEQALAQAVVEQAALAIENARLLEEAQRLARREQMIGEISDRLRRTPSVETILRTTLTELTEALGAQTGSVRIDMRQTDDTFIDLTDSLTDAPLAELPDPEAEADHD